MRNRRAMYPELYPEFEGRGRRIRGFALSLFGSFVFMLTSLVAVTVSSQPFYLGIAGLSLGAVVLIYLAHRTLSVLGTVIFLISASATLATEAAVVAIYFPAIVAGVCAVFTLGGSLITARGIHDIESLSAREPLPRKRREMAIEQGGA